MQKFKNLFTLTKTKTTKALSSEGATVENKKKSSKNNEALKKEVVDLVRVYEKRLPVAEVSLLDMIVCVIKKNDKPLIQDSFCSLASLFQNVGDMKQFSQVIEQLFLKCFLNVEFKQKLANSLIKAKNFKNLGFDGLEFQLFNCTSVMKKVLAQPSLSFQAMHALSKDFDFKGNMLHDLSMLKNGFNDFFGILKIISSSVKYSKDTLDEFIESKQLLAFITFSIYFEGLFNMDFDVMNSNSLYKCNYTDYCKFWDLVIFHVVACINQKKKKRREEALLLLAQHLLKAVFFVEKIRHEQVMVLKKQKKNQEDPYLSLRFNNLMRFFTIVLFNLFEIKIVSKKKISLKSKEKMEDRMSLWKTIKSSFETKEIKLFFKQISLNIIFYTKRMAKLHKKYDDLLMIESQFEYDKYLLLFVQMLFNVDFTFQEIFESTLEAQLKQSLKKDDSNEALSRFFEKQFFFLHETFYSPLVAQFFFLPLSFDFYKNDLNELYQENFINILKETTHVETMIIFFVKVRKTFKFEEVQKLAKLPFQSIVSRPSNFFLELLLEKFCTFDIKNNRFVLVDAKFDGKRKKINNSFELSYRDNELIKSLNARNRSLIINKTVYFPENLFFLKENSLLELNEHIKEFTSNIDKREIWVNTDENTLSGLQEKTQFHLKLLIDLFNCILERDPSKQTKTFPQKKFNKFKKFMKNTLSKPSKEKLNSSNQKGIKKVKKEQMTGDLVRLAKHILILGNIARSHSLQISSLYYFVQNFRPVLPESLWKLCDTITGEEASPKKDSQVGADSNKIKVETPKSKNSNRLAKLMKKIKKKKKKNYKATEKIVEEKTGIKIEENFGASFKRKKSNTEDVCISCQNGFEKDEDIFYLIRLHKYDVHRLLLFQNYWDVKKNINSKKLSSKKIQSDLLYRVWNNCKVTVPTSCNHPYHLKCIRKTLQNKKPVCLLCKTKCHVYMNRKLLTTSEIKSEDLADDKKIENEDSSVNSELSRGEELPRFDDITSHFLSNEMEDLRLSQMMKLFAKNKSDKTSRHPNPKIDTFQQIFHNLLKTASISKKLDVDIETKSFGIKLYHKLMMPVEMVSKMIHTWCPDNFSRKIFPCLSQYFYILFSLKNLNECAFMEFSMICNDINEVLTKYMDDLKSRDLVHYTEMMTKEIAFSSMEVFYTKLFLAKFWSSVSALTEINCVKKEITPIFEEINQEILSKILLIKIYQNEENNLKNLEINSETIISSCTDILKIIIILENLIFQKNLDVGSLDSPDRLNGKTNKTSSSRIPFWKASAVRRITN